MIGNDMKLDFSLTFLINSHNEKKNLVRLQQLEPEIIRPCMLFIVRLPQKYQQRTLKAKLLIQIGRDQTSSEFIDKENKHLDCFTVAT